MTNTPLSYVGWPPRAAFGLWIAAISFFLICFCLSPAQAQQWTGPDGSSNIYNSNTTAGAVIIQSTTANAGQKFVVNPNGAGGMVIGNPNTGGGGFTGLLFAISAAQNGYSTIQSIQSAGSAFGALGLNHNGGNVGIHTTTPQAPLEVQSGGLGTTVGSTIEITRMDGLTGNNSQLRFLLNRYAAGTSWVTASTRIQAYTDANAQAYLDFNPNGGAAALAFGSGSGELMRMTSAGNLLIGKTSQANPGYILDVNGNARANEVVVNTTGADFVFDPGYQLAPIEDLDTYVHLEHHLPGIATAYQMQKQGLGLGDNQMRLLAKVEELTLYLIAAHKETSALKKQVSDGNRALENLEKRIQRLEQSDTQAAHK